LRALLLMLPLAALACHPTPNRKSAASPTPAASQARRSVAARPCVAEPGRYDPCLTGKRGTPQLPCFEIAAFLTAAVERRDVHEIPDAASKVLGQVLGPSPGEEGRPAPFELLDSRDGWLLIQDAADDPRINGGVYRPMYHGKGWIRGEGVAAIAQAEQGFARPDFASEVAVTSKASWLDADMIAVLGCDGSWVHARWKPRNNASGYTYRPDAVVSRDPLVLEGWATGICPIMETTCDRLSGDRPAEGSFVPERIDRIEAGGAARGEETEDDPDEG
jgi:hypothetical protein